MASESPSTTPKTTSPKTMITNVPNRSTSESVGVTPRLKPMRDHPISRSVTTHPTTSVAQTMSRGTAGRQALAAMSAADIAMATTY